MPVTESKGAAAAMCVTPASQLYLLDYQTENEFRNIKLKLKGPNRHSELQAVKALMAMSAQHHNIPIPQSPPPMSPPLLQPPLPLPPQQPLALLSPVSLPITPNQKTPTSASQGSDKPLNLSRSDSPEPIYGLSISMTEEEFRELARKEGIKDVIGEPVCRLCNGLFSGPLGIALHMCPAMKRQTYRCEICGEDKWKTKANLHSHIKWCKKRLNMKIEQHEEQTIY